MKFQSKAIKLLVVGVLSLFIAGPVAAKESLRIGMECNYFPFNYQDANGDLLGYDVDVAKGVTDILGVEVEFVCQAWDGMIPALLANKFDLIVASMSITKSRAKKIDFSIPYRVSVGRLIGSKKVNVELFDKDGKAIVENFNEVRIGIERASTYASYFKAKFPDAKVILYDGTETGYLDLMNGRVDMIMTNPMKAHLKFLSKPDGAGYEFKSPPIDEVEFFGPGCGIGMKQGQPELKARVDAALKKLIKDGKLTEYALKTFPFPIHNEEWSEL
ncbi:MAG: polar amino acid transport system substrate-binding protein [Desulforhopalus sp.]|jgi:polar amino acid transport system substrate-binding protein